MTDRPFGRQPTALHGLAGSIEFHLRQGLTAAHAIDTAVHVKTFWLRQGRSTYGTPDYNHAYVWMAPVVMSPALCEQIEQLVAARPGVIRTGRGGGDPDQRLRPFVWAVVDLSQRSS